jgi:hypothetical protein
MVKKGRPSKPLVHGTDTGYGKGCRCADCRAAHAEHGQYQREMYRMLAAIDPSVVKEHGTRSAYTQYKCRCEACRAANREYGQKRRRRLAELEAQMFEFTAYNLPAEVVAVYNNPGADMVALANILNTYEHWRRSQLTKKDEGPNDRIEDAQPGSM